MREVFRHLYIKHMGIESMRNDDHPLRRELAEMTSPLAKLLFAMPQDRSLERIDAALNGLGEPWGTFDLVETEDDAQAIFKDLKALTDLPEGSREAVAQARKICDRINAL